LLFESIEVDILKITIFKAVKEPENERKKLLSEIQVRI